jgi:hypothetical protein
VQPKPDVVFKEFLLSLDFHASPLGGFVTFGTCPESKAIRDQGKKFVINQLSLRRNEITKKRNYNKSASPTA